MDIQAMKNQTFGVEVEMNSIRREKAAELAANYFGTGRTEFKGTCYETYSAYDAQGREWKFMRDGSIHGVDAECCEMVTPILHYDDIELLQGLIRVLRKAGAKSDAGRGCGVHIHVGAEGHTAKTLRNLTNLMASHEDLIIDALRISRSRVNSYCHTVDPKFLLQVNRKKPETMADLADVWYGSQFCDNNRNAHYNSSRYHMLNLHATFTKGTVEFRMFEFYRPTARHKNGLHAGALKSWIQFCLAVSQFAKEARNISAKPQQTENPKYAMRTWLLRLGFIGEEFATAREVFTRNLKGNAAWRQAA